MYEVLVIVEDIDVTVVDVVVARVVMVVVVGCETVVTVLNKSLSVDRPVTVTLVNLVDNEVVVLVTDVELTVVLFVVVLVKDVLVDVVITVKATAKGAAARSPLGVPVTVIEYIPKGAERLT